MGEIIAVYVGHRIHDEVELLRFIFVYDDQSQHREYWIKPYPPPKQTRLDPVIVPKNRD